MDQTITFTLGSFLMPLLSLSPLQALGGNNCSSFFPITGSFSFFQSLIQMEYKYYFFQVDEGNG